MELYRLYNLLGIKSYKVTIMQDEMEITQEEIAVYFREVDWEDWDEQ